MELKKNRTASFIIVAIIYVLASIVGIATYLLLPFDLWLNLLIADVVATVFTFIFSLIFKNASVYDPYWSVQPIVIVVAFAFANSLTPITACLIGAICFWGIRLTANWAYTFRSLEHQDWRYTMLCEKCKGFYPIINFVGIHLVPTLVVYGCTLPACILITTAHSASVWSYLAVALSVCAAVLQLVSDIQMQKFRKNRTSTFIRTGLWKYSRHPNYLGEILMWWGVGLCVVSCLPSCWYLLAGALSNTALFLCVSIPMADGRNAKKEGWEEYKKHTFALLPIYHR